MLPAVSIAMGIALIALGWIRLGKTEAFRDQMNGRSRPSPAWGITAGRSRWHRDRRHRLRLRTVHLGYGQAKVWENLRGGSVYSVGSALFGLAIAIAHFADRRPRQCAAMDQRCPLDHDDRPAALRSS